MARVTVDQATGSLVVDGDKVFPIGLSNPPPPDSRTPAGRNGLEEVAANGVSFVRTGMQDWELEFSDGQIAQQKQLHAAAFSRGLRCWLWLGDAPNLPAQAGSPREQLLTKIVTAFRGDDSLLAYKGIDEPANPLRGEFVVPPPGMTRAFQKIRSLDPNHPVVVVQAPRGAVSTLVPYRPTFDVTGVDIYPIAYPPGQHSDLGNRDINVVGELARKMRQAAGTKPFWMTLQIAWSGVLPTQSSPNIVPRFPNLTQERFMAYQAIVNGARGLAFFGGHLTPVMTPADAASGWNWTFWRRVLRPVVSELASSDLQPALVAPAGNVTVTAASPDIELVTRRTADHLYLIAVRIGGSVSQVRLSGLPASISRGEVLFEYVQEPLPPPTLPPAQARQVPRTVRVSGGAFSDWFAPHDAHVYRFEV